MQFRPKLAAIAALAAAALGAAQPCGAATLSFRGGGPAPLPTDYVSYMRYVYCDRLPPGAGATDPRCRAVGRWMRANVGRPLAAYSPAPVIR